MALCVGTVLLLVWMMAWSFAVMSVLPKWQGGSLYGILVHQLFTMYWVSEVIRNVTHVTVCGSHASWYFAGDNYRAANPTLGAFRRAATYSFGSICFGSLLVAILQTLRRLFQVRVCLVCSLAIAAAVNVCVRCCVLETLATWCC